MKLLAAVICALGLVACTQSARLQDIGDQLGCDETRESGTIDMRGTGVVGICDELPEGYPGIVMSFRDEGQRDRFFSEIWEETDFLGSFVLMGEDWALAVSATTIEAAAELKQRVGGITWPQWRAR